MRVTREVPVELVSPRTDRTLTIRLSPPVPRVAPRLPRVHLPAPAPVGQIEAAPRSVPTRGTDVLPVPIVEPPRDTAVVTAAPSPVLLAPPLPTVPLPTEKPPPPPADVAVRGNSAAAPAGVVRQPTILSEAARDSIAKRMAQAFLADLKRPLTPDEEAAARRQREPGGSSTASPGAGHSGGGSGLGAGASVVLPVGVPILNPGPSAAQRARDAAIDAENRARISRMMQIVAARRDSIRADSLRRDSLARNGRP